MYPKCKYGWHNGTEIFTMILRTIHTHFYLNSQVKCNFFLINFFLSF